MPRVIAFSLLITCLIPLAAQDDPPADAASPEVLGQTNVAGVEVSGLTLTAARAKLEKDLDAKLDHPILLTDGVLELSQTRRELFVSIALEPMLELARQGAEWVPLKLTVDRLKLQAWLRELAPGFAFAGRNAKPYAWQGGVRILPAQFVREVDVPTSTQAFANKIETEPAVSELFFALDKHPPRVTEADLKGIDAKIGEFVTRFDPGNRPRTHNVRLGAQAIDGTLLRPEEIFSLNDTVGQRTPERGYQKATIFVDGQLEPGYGGGISQVTGTLFNAALVAGLRIVTYRCHSRPVSYLPLGRDATVAWGAFDMKFRNSTPAPIYIQYTIDGNRLIAVLFGQRERGLEVEIETEVDRPGPRHILARLYRTIKRGGAGERKLLGTSEYKWEPKPEPEPAPEE